MDDFSLFSIFVVLLEDEHKIVHVSFSDCDFSTISVEIECLFDLAKIYKPISLEKTIPIPYNYWKNTENASTIYVDEWVKNYMFDKNNTKKVRGGSYFMNELDTISVQLLKRECEERQMNYPKHGYEIRYIREKYVIPEWTPLDACLEIERVKDLMCSYMELKTKIEKMKKKMDNEIVKNIHWLKLFCLNQYTKKNTESSHPPLNLHELLKWQNKHQEQIEKYNKILVEMKKIFHLYCLEFPNEQDKIDGSNGTKNLFVHYPNFLLDDFFLHKNPENIDQVYYVTDQILYMFERLKKWLDHCEKEKKQMENEIPNIEWSVPNILYFLQKKIKK